MDEYLTENKKLIFTIFPYDKNSGGNSIIPDMIKCINKLYIEPIIYVLYNIIYIYVIHMYIYHTVIEVTTLRRHLFTNCFG